MFSMLLPLGLLAVFVGVSAVLFLGMGLTRERSQVANSLAILESVGPVPDSMKKELDVPFADRVVRPTMEGLRKAALRATASDWHERASKRLDLAGNPVGWDTDRLLAMKGGLALVLGSCAGLLFFMKGSLGWALVAGLGMLAFGFFLPDILLLNTAQKRSERIRRELPDALDLLTISVESGLALDAAIAQVASNSSGPLTDEFHRTLKEIQLGAGRTAALRAMADRSDVDDLRNFIASLAQAETLGIPIADVLRVQSKEMRLKRSQRAEEQAMKLPVKLIFPVLLLILPAVFIVILGPAAMDIGSMFSRM